MASYAVIRPSQHKYALMKGMIASTSPSPAWLDGAVLSTASGLLVEPANTTLGGFATGPVYQTTLGPNIIGFAASAFTLAATAVGGAAIGAETQSPVGAGSAISGVRRTFYRIDQPITWTGSLDTSGSQGATALSVTDVGTLFSLSPVNASGAITAGGQWIVNRTLLANGLTVKVTRLIDPPGAKFGDTPVPGINTGQALVEFVVLPVAWAL
jgi:hypothetical protein